MKRKSSPISYFVIIFIIGVISMFFNSDMPLAGMIQNWKNYDIEVLLEYLNIGLAFLALGGIFIFLIVRAARDDKSYFWDFNKDHNKEEEE